MSEIGFSQVKTPAASLKAEIEQMVGLTDVELVYSNRIKKGEKFLEDWFLSDKFGGPEPMKIQPSNLEMM